MQVKNYLISKTTKKFVDYEGNLIRLTDATPYTVDEVLIGRKEKPYAKVTTFRDSLGRMLERVFNIKGKPLKNRIYLYSDGVVGDNEYVNITTIKEFSLKRNLIDIYRRYLEEFNIKTTLWEKEKVQTNYVAEDILTNKKTLSMSIIENLKNGLGHKYHELTEFPQIVNAKIQNSLPKVLSFTVDSNNDVVDGLVATQNIKAPEKDSFLGFRLLDLEDFKIPITQKFLRDRDIDFLGYEIDKDSLMGDFSETRSGEFGNGIISFNKLFNFKTKAKFASTARHEVEHGWQYFLDARNGGRRGDFFEGLGTLYGKITDKKLLKEANNYTKSIDTYVPPEKDYNRYKKNYIEIKANEAGAKARKDYIEQGEEICNEFRHIPSEFL